MANLEDPENPENPKGYKIKQQLNEVFKKNGKTLSSTGFSALLFVNNATEVNFQLLLKLFDCILNYNCYNC